MTFSTSRPRAATKTACASRWSGCVTTTAIRPPRPGRRPRPRRAAPAAATTHEPARQRRDGLRGARARPLRAHAPGRDAAGRVVRAGATDGDLPLGGRRLTQFLSRYPERTIHATTAMHTTSRKHTADRLHATP